MSSVIDIIIRSKDETGDGVASASKSGHVLTGVFQGIGQAAGNLLADLPGQALGFFKSAIDGASDLGETVSKNQTIFGDASKELIVWAETAPKALGMTKNAALDATGTFGNLFTQLGVSADAARKMSQANVSLATDFASFHNADPAEVIEAMTAAYRGEFDAVQRFVPLLNAANVEEEALSLSKKKSKDALTEQDKALAVNSLMMKGAGAAAGDFARTSDSAANRSRIAAASFEEMKTKIGNVLLPAWTMLLGFITGSFFPALVQLGALLGSVVGPIFEEISGGVRAFAAAFQAADGDITSSGFAGWLENLGFVARQVFDTLLTAWARFTGAFSTGMTENEGSWTGFVNIVEQLGLIARQVFEWLSANGPNILASVGAAFTAVVDKVRPLWEALNMNQGVLIGLAAVITTVLLGAVWSLVAAVGALAVSVIAATWPFVAIVLAIAAVVQGLRYAYENWEWFRTAVDTVVQWLITTVPPIFEAVRAAIAAAFEWVVNVAVPAITGAFSSFMGFLQGTFLPAAAAIWSAYVTYVQTMVDLVRPIIDFLVGFIQENFGHLQAIVAAIWGMISSNIANTWQIISNIFQMFLNIITGNWSGAWGNIQNIISGAMDIVRNVISNGFTVVREVLQGILSFVGSIAGRLGEGLINAGRSMIDGLWRGIQERIDWVKSQISGALSSVRNLFPFSPAKEGPFSGRGWVTYSGQSIATDFAKGITSKVAGVARAASGIMSTAAGELGGLDQYANVGLVGGVSAGMAGGFGAPPVTIINNVNVAGSIRSDRELVQIIRDENANLGLR